MTLCFIESQTGCALSRMKMLHIQDCAISVMNETTPGGTHIDMVYICACLLGCFFADIGKAIGEFSSQLKAPNLHKLGVF